jgi:hypothetical protein
MPRPRNSQFQPYGSLRACIRSKEFGENERCASPSRRAKQEIQSIVDGAEHRRRWVESFAALSVLFEYRLQILKLRNLLGHAVIGWALSVQIM